MKKTQGVMKHKLKASGISPNNCWRTIVVRTLITLQSQIRLTHCPLSKVAFSKHGYVNLSCAPPHIAFIRGVGSGSGGKQVGSKWRRQIIIFFFFKQKMSFIPLQE